ncbi:uncharacterized protein PAC_11163 [Phialocephala subalpina]|uniref:2EXR domain-containing protein n=1 Tax=Phialocephala subalpina TaxID=576137 RepID=A0A1L7X8E7_9HELO|nr:uncharacterized protein PAC_11163 [Phialocephala subalpina]
MALITRAMASDNDPRNNTTSAFDFFCDAASALELDDNKESLPVVASIFHQFPKLPYELREQVWKLALPSKLRMLRVRVKFVPKDSKDPDKPSSTTLEFRVSRDSQETNPIRVNKSELALSITCRESRDTYLDRHPNTLPAAKGAFIRYNTNNTIVSIRNYDYLAGNADRGWFWDLIYKQQCLKRIKMLALPSTWISEQIDDRYPVLSQFVQLETLIAVTNVESRASFYQQFPASYGFVLQKDQKSIQEYAEKKFRFRYSVAPTVVMMDKNGFFDERAYRGQESWDLEEVL